MIKLIKTFLLIATFSTAFNVNAQDKPVSIGIKGGANMFNLIGIDNLYSKVGFNIGATLDVALGSNFYFLTGLDFSSKSAVYEKEILVLKLKGEFNPMYLQLPAHIGYKLPLSEKVKLVFHAGPYFAYGIGGTFKANGSLDILGTNIDANLNENLFADGYLKRTDFGVGVGIGAEVGGFFIDVCPDFGLVNISNTATEKLNIKSNSTTLSAGYKF